GGRCTCARLHPRRTPAFVRVDSLTALARPARLHRELSVGQMTLQHFSRRGARQLTDERDVAWNREATQAVSDVVLDHCFVQRRAFGPDDERGEALTELRIGNADHCHLENLWQGGDSFL